MKRFRTRHVRRVIVPVVALTLLSSCHTWKHQEMAPSQVVSEKEPGKIRPNMLDGDRIYLDVGHPLRGRYALKSYILPLATDSSAYAATRSNNDVLLKVLVGAALVITVVHIVIKSLVDSYDGPFGGCCH